MTQKIEFSPPQKNNKPIEVAIVYHYVAHYRKAIFQHLSNYSGIKFTIISGKETDINIKILDEAYSKIPISEGGIRWEFITNHWLPLGFLWQSGLLKKILSRKYSAIIFIGNAYYLSTWVAAILCKLMNIKVLMWGHGFLREEHGVKKFVRTLFYRLSPTHLIYSGRSVQLMKNQGLSHKNLLKVNNCLDYPEHIKLRDKVSKSTSPYSSNGRKILVFVGRLTPQKKLDQLINATFLLQEKKIDVELHFIGDGEERQRLTKIVNSSPYGEKITFHGACYDEEVLAGYLYHADLCVSPGEVGLTAIHSMMFGTPVITHDNFDEQMPEYEAIIPGKTGDFFRQGCSDSLAESIEKWLDHAPPRESIRRACFKKIDEEFTPDYQLSQFISALSAETYDA